MRQGQCIGSPEEVAWRKGFIDDESLKRLIAPFSGSEYGESLKSLLVLG
jgi:glucose-1-phosphate thymidylyltransferase